MGKKTSFLPGLHRALFGRPPVSTVEKLSRRRGELDELCLSQLTALFGAFLPAKLLDFKPASGANSRRRVYTPMVTFWAFLGQVLSPGSSCRKAVSNVQALFAARQLDLPSCDTKSYCSARKRLPVRLLLEVHTFVVSRLQAGVQGTGPRTLVVDGSTASMPDTPENQKKYPQHMQIPGCGFPIMKLVGLFCLESGAWIATAKCHMKIHETRLFQRLFKHLRKGDTLLGDRAYCSYWNIAKLSSKGVDFVMRNHQRRIVDFRKGERLGKQDHCILWIKPKQRSSGMSKEEYDAYPDHLVVRETQLRTQRKGYRTGTIVIVSSFINAEEKTTDELGDYFLRRWKVELYFGDIKTSQAMDVLRTKSPPLICRELLMHMIAYNLTRAVAQQSSANSTTPLADCKRVSFKGTADRIATWSWSIWAAPSAKKAQELANQFRATIAEDLVRERPGRREVRAKKRRPKNYPLLNKRRKEMVEITHRNNYRASA